MNAWRVGAAALAVGVLAWSARLGAPVPGPVRVAHPSVLAIPRAGQAWWLDRQRALVERVRDAATQAGTPHASRVVFVGDSITQQWETVGAAEWARRFGPLHAINLGIGGDRTQHALWRLCHSGIESLNADAPDALVVLIGTNNVDEPAGEIVAGVRAVVEQGRAALPATPIVVMAILPRSDAYAGDPVKVNEKFARVNAALARLHDPPRVRFLDLTRRFMGPDGLPPKELMPDRLHLSASGYAIWGEELGRVLWEMGVRMP